ncbi:hypothetical protein HanXRQr2_Chr02g0075461 [Helianthus annuus]|uniref:Uncharacterized protein n=1 Tax=Helianthus annuus TaxID=4232 RepID=A0A9K3P0W2_HELAN|nr:hypothetical protein HanXRQr2_Chr02g0075461 [Helianthus annuus]
MHFISQTLKHPFKSTTTRRITSLVAAFFCVIIDLWFHVLGP